MPADVRPATPERHLATAGVVAAVTMLAYWRVAVIGFVADDYFILSRVQAGDGVANPGGYFGFGFFDYYRPLGFISHAIDWTLWGLNPAAFHLTNLVLHAVSSVLVFVIARRLMDGLAAGVAMLLFAFHAANHEAVYWVAARFDLLATCFALLALVWLWADRPIARAAGIVCYALALLSKESALSLLVIAAALDVFVRRRAWPDVVRRLVPLLMVTVAYVALRAAATDIVIAGGERRLPKLVLLGVALGALVWMARSATQANGWDRVTRRLRPPVLVMGATIGGVLVAGALGLSLPASAAWTREKLGFVAYAAYYLVSPVVTLGPPTTWFEPARITDAVAGLVVLTLAVSTFVVLIARTKHLDRLGFLVFAIIGALLPVLSMTGGTRYLYLASAVVSWAGAWAFQWTLTTRARALALLVLPLMVMVSIQQIGAKGRDWHWASELTRRGLDVMARDLEPCGTKHVVLLTAPAGIRGVYSNIPWEAFNVERGCAPASLRTLLRVVGADAVVAVRVTQNGTIEIGVPDYVGQIVASADLSRFDRPIAPGTTARLDTPLGTLETMPIGTTQLFRLTRTDAEPLQFFYYGYGEIRAVRRPGL
jgi:hypothetical protein